MRRILGELRRGAQVDGPILGGILIVWLILLTMLAYVGVSGLRVSSYANNFMLYLSSLLFFVIFIAGRKLYRARPDSPIRFLLELAKEPEWQRTFARGVPMLLALILFMPAFSAMKSAIPLFNSYSWDGVLIEADRAIHGTDPWRLLQPLLGIPIVTSALSVAYHTWVLLIYFGGVYFCFLTKNRELRAQYFIGFFAIWTLIGVALATGFASVGPCFLAPLAGNHGFEEQMAYLYAANEQFPVMVLPVQEQLLVWHLEGSHGLARGITAMPSMHVSLALLFYLAVRRISRRAGFWALAFLVVIMMSSVHLAYHYAVDGYVSVGVTLVIWALAKPLAKLVARDRKEPGALAEPLPEGPRQGAIPA